jgi:peptidoglycan L-alanyl-D-glutamate endopeptidase CwlK
MSSNPQTTGGAAVRHKVRPGETMVAIAKRHGVTLKALQAANPQIKNINKISVGQIVNVPASLVPAPTPVPPPVTPTPAPPAPVATPAPTPVVPTPVIVSPDSAAFAAMDKRGKTKRLHPIFRERLILLAEALARRGMQALITDGLRTVAEQDALFAQGRTKPGPRVTNARGGQSNHNYGLAVDMYPVIGGKVFTDVAKGASVEFRRAFNAVQDAIGEEAERLGLFWGARFNGIVDTPHIQLLPEQELRPSEAFKILNKAGGDLAAVWAEATKRVKPLAA